MPEPLTLIKFRFTLIGISLFTYSTGCTVADSEITTCKKGMKYSAAMSK